MNWYITALKKYAVFTGRARRKEFWFFTLFSTIFAILALVLDSLFTFTLSVSSYGMLYLAYTLATLIPNLAVTVRRLHDIGRSGWWFFIVLVPFIGGIVLLVFLFLDSEPSSNKWGPNPKTTSDTFSNDALDSHLAT